MASAMPWLVRRRQGSVRIRRTRQEVCVLVLFARILVSARELLSRPLLAEGPELLGGFGVEGPGHDAEALARFFDGGCDSAVFAVDAAAVVEVLGGGGPDGGV